MSNCVSGHFKRDHAFRNVDTRVIKIPKDIRVIDLDEHPIGTPVVLRCRHNRSTERNICNIDNLPFIACP